MKAVNVKVHSEQLANWLNEAPHKSAQSALGLHVEFEGNLRTALAEYPNNEEGIAAGSHEFIDEMVIEQRARAPATDAKVSCRRGCGHCCRLNVTVTAGEAKLALIAAEEFGWRIDPQRLRVQAAVDGIEGWNELDDADRACVFLTSGEDCAIYEHRPMACRKYMVVNPPDDCDSIRKPGQRIIQWIVPEAEVAFSASLEVFEGGPMAAMLLAECEHEGELS